MITLMKKLLFISLEERMTDNVVFVCGDDTDVSCKPCGRITERLGGIEWTEITCRDSGLFRKCAESYSYYFIPPNC